MAMTRAAMAEGLGCDPALVTRYRRRGMPMDSIDAALAWKRRHVRQRISGDGAGAAAPPAVEEESSDPYWSSRARREAAEADLAELKLRELRGELLRREVMERVVGEQAARTKEAVLQIKGRISPLLAAESDVLKVTAMLDAELRAALSKGAG